MFGFKQAYKNMYKYIGRWFCSLSLVAEQCDQIGQLLPV